MIYLVVIFFLSVLAVFHTYVLYPWILDQLDPCQGTVYPESELPSVDIVIAAYNEEAVIERKILSVIEGNYPNEKLRILVGSDGSTDETDNIVKRLAKGNHLLELFRFQRTGKTEVVNQLMKQVKAPIVVLTDANVLFSENLLEQLLMQFSNPKVGLVGANIKALKDSNQGITHQENEYLQRENRMKYKEGQRWGTMMGAFGGCYAIRTTLFRPVPKHFLVDDFHISMSVINQGYNAILSKDAMCTEDISSKLSEEFRRKVRMSRGNFQNLRVFSSLLFSRRKGLSFSFWSHKVLRWFTPLFMIAALLSSFALMESYFLFKCAFFLQLTLLCVPIMEITMDSLGIRFRMIRFLTYFLSMNLALLVGMLKSFTKTESAIWQPTERNI